MFFFLMDLWNIIFFESDFMLFLNLFIGVFLRSFIVKDKFVVFFGILNVNDLKNFLRFCEILDFV